MKYLCVKLEISPSGYYVGTSHERLGVDVDVYLSALREILPNFLRLKYVIIYTFVDISLTVDGFVLKLLTK